MAIETWALSNWSLFSKIGVCAAGVVVGGIVTLSNTGEGYTTYLLRSVPDDHKPLGGWETAMDGKHFHDAPLVSYPYDKLLKGDAGYNGGNYVIYYGSMACPHCTGFLFNDQSIASGKTSLSEHKMSEGAWMKAFQFSKEDPVLSQKKIKFLMYDDMPDKAMVDKEGDKYWTLPWATDNAKNTYIRNDRSAQEIRTIIDKAQEIFKAEKVPGTPTVIVYKEGKPKVFNQDVLQGLENDPKQGEDMSNQSQLVRFLKHYFTYVEK